MVAKEIVANTCSGSFTETITVPACEIDERTGLDFCGSREETNTYTCAFLQLGFSCLA